MKRKGNKVMSAQENKVVANLSKRTQVNKRKEDVEEISIGRPVSAISAEESCSLVIGMSVLNKETQVVSLASADDLNKTPSLVAETLYEFASDLEVLEGECAGCPDDCCCRQDSKYKLELGLLYTSMERIRVKDFFSEVRAFMDVEQFVHQAELILDMKLVAVEDIVQFMLEQVVENDRAPSSRLSEAKEDIFIQGSAAMLLAKTIQGMSYVSDSTTPVCASSIQYDQSWLCALCSVAQITRRHIVIARFKQPTKMSTNADCVRIFALVVTPSKEKGTKNAFETGRTFATMLKDVSFRQKLLEAKNETEFKTLMITRAQHLSKLKALKNRHKYDVGPAVRLSASSINDGIQYIGKGIEKTGLPTSDAVTFEASFDSNNNNSNSTGTRQFNKVFDRNPRAGKLLELISQPVNLNAELLDSNFNSCTTKDASKKKQQSFRKEGQDEESSCNLTSFCNYLEPGVGLWADFKRRVRFYPSDFKDAFVGPPKTVQKTIATIWFLYFGILLPTIAFSALNTTQTHGHMGDLRKAIIGQAIGGLGFALLGGQPLVIIMTTAPLCLYTKAMYAAVGLWNGFFLMIYSLFGFSRLMKWCTRSTEEIFALFIVVAFITDAGKDLMKNLNKYYYTPACEAANETVTNLAADSIAHIRSSDEDSMLGSCRRETSLLFILLMLGTLWLATTLYRFNRTPYLQASKRELLADYALPAAVIVMSFVGSYLFDDIYVEKFPPLTEIQFERAQVELLPLSGILTAFGLGFTLSLLFFMDQNISAAMVNAPQNGLKKGCAYHYDLLVVAILNGFLSMYGLPMMHGVLPHSPLHVRSLADIEERVEEGHLREVILNVRETRVTAIVSHILVLASLLLVPYPIAYIPTAVLNGLFLYMAVTSLDGLQTFERILLLFTEQSKYPPNHYIRRCPQKKIHQFTLLQLLQLLVMCFFGFSPYNIVEMFFPVVILLMIPFRHKIVPKIIDVKFLDALDGKH